MNASQPTTAYGIATDIVKVAVIAASLVFHKTLDLNGTDEAVIAAVLSTAISAKYVAHVVSWAKPVVTKEVKAVTAVDPNAEAQLKAIIANATSELNKMGVTV